MSTYAEFLTRKKRIYTGNGIAPPALPARQPYAEFLAAKRIRLARRVYIYALIDPFAGDVRYVGKSVRPKQRLQNHCNERARTWRTNWIQSVIARGQRPRLRVLEILDRDDDWRQAEIAWIARMRADGEPLTNCTSGGDGVPDLPPEIRARISAVWRGRKHSPETRARLGAGMRGRHHTDEHREHMRRIMRGRVVTWGDKLRHAIEKLSADQVRAIRAELADGKAQRAIAARFGVHQGTICNIKRGVSYGWVQ